MQELIKGSNFFFFVFFGIVNKKKKCWSFQKLIFEADRMIELSRRLRMLLEECKKT